MQSVVVSNHINMTLEAIEFSQFRIIIHNRLSHCIESQILLTLIFTYYLIFIYLNLNLVLHLASLLNSTFEKYHTVLEKSFGILFFERHFKVGLKGA